MQSRVNNVDTYVEEVDERWRLTAERLQRLCREVLTDYEESMAYGMPTYSEDGAFIVAFARQAKYFSLYVARKGVLDGFRDQFAGLSLGKGCIRFQRPEQVDWSVIDLLLHDVVNSAEPPC
jgi:uncharacterized protein YdhG (YjbR/CyaY superfamily)